MKVWRHTATHFYPRHYININDHFSASYPVLFSTVPIKLYKRCLDTIFLIIYQHTAIVYAA